jgi:hypothetical protein
VAAHLSVEQRQLARRLRAKGLSLREIGAQVGCSHEVVRIICRRPPRRPVHRDGWLPGPGTDLLLDGLRQRADQRKHSFVSRYGRGSDDCGVDWLQERPSVDVCGQYARIVRH